MKLWFPDIDRAHSWIDDPELSDVYAKRNESGKFMLLVVSGLLHNEQARSMPSLLLFILNCRQIYWFLGSRLEADVLPVPGRRANPEALPVCE